MAQVTIEYDGKRGKIAWDDPVPNAPITGLKIDFPLAAVENDVRRFLSERIPYSAITSHRRL